jgi:hypothetical protein
MSIVDVEAYTDGKIAELWDQEEIKKFYNYNEELFRKDIESKKKGTIDSFNALA